MNLRTSALTLLVLIFFGFASCKKAETSIPEISIPDTISIVEGTLSQVKVIIPVSLNAPSDKQVSLSWSVTGNTAGTDEDFISVSGAYLMFSPGETKKNIEVWIANDAFFEPNETFSVTISNVKNAIVKNFKTIVTILNDDAPDSNPGISDILLWVTKPDKSALLEKQNVNLNFNFNSGLNAYSTIDVDTATKYQSIDGFGFALTGVSAYLINHLPSNSRDALLRELFSTDENSIGVSYLRISIGASDLSSSVFSYDDLPSGQTDVNLDKFSLEKETADLIPVLKSILLINPKIKILGSPWSPPVWMKSNKNSVGGSLLPEYYNAYARYFVRYINEMKLQGIRIDAITVQNEPLNPGNNPSMSMSAVEQANFIKSSLGPEFEAAGITTKLILYDHNCDKPDYPLSILGDADVAKYVDGSAFHLYGGDISALSTVHNAFPDKNVYFTEQWVGRDGNFGGDLQWHMQNVLIGSMRNWSRNVIEWNLAWNPSNDPKPVGCPDCEGALSITTGYSRNVSYYIIAHASKFVPAGSVRVATNTPPDLLNVAFQTPEGKKVLIVFNNSSVKQTFNISVNQKRAVTSLTAGAVGTYVWK